MHYRFSAECIVSLISKVSGPSRRFPTLIFITFSLYIYQSATKITTPPPPQSPHLSFAHDILSNLGHLDLLRFINVTYDHSGAWICRHNGLTNLALCHQVTFAAWNNENSRENTRRPNHLKVLSHRAPGNIGK